MKPARHLVAVILAAAFGAARAEVLPEADTRYVKRIDGRFATFAGSSSNLESLAVGLRHGSRIELSGSGESATVLPPTRPMGYGNVTRSLDLASRQLAAVGITEPTPREISAALNGGTVSTATGEVTLKGVLQLRSTGMGWGQIAHAIGVHPGMGPAKALPAPVTGVSGITAAGGSTIAKPGASAGHGRDSARPALQGSAVTSAAGAAVSSSAPGLSLSKGQGNANAGGRGAGKI